MVKTRRKNDWMAVVNAVRSRTSISSVGIARLAKKHTNASPDYALRYLRRKGVLQRSESAPRGVYVVATGKDDAFIADPIGTVQAAYGEDTLFGYGTALFLHGLSRYAHLSEYIVVSSAKRKQRSMGSFVIRFVRTPLTEEMGSATIRHGRIPLRVTDLERTLIDCIHRPKYAQGWENVAHALSRADKVNTSRIIEYVKQYRMPSLVAKVGLILEHYASRWKVSQESLGCLRPYLPRPPVKFSRESRGSLNKNWNIYVPEGVFHE